MDGDAECFLKYATREVLNLHAIGDAAGVVPHLEALCDMVPGQVSKLTAAVCNMLTVDATVAPESANSETTFHRWLQANATLGQIEFFYNSPLYKAFLQARFNKLFSLAQNKPGSRDEIVKLLLGSVKPGSDEHAALVFAQTMDDESKPKLEKLRVLWNTPKVDDLLRVWNLTGWQFYSFSGEGVPQDFGGSGYQIG